MRGAGYYPGIISAANSAATIRYPEVHYDMCGRASCSMAITPALKPRNW